METLFLAIGSTLTVGAASSPLLAVAYRMMRRHLLRLSPGQRTTALLGWSASPLFTGLFFTALLFFPSLLNILGIPAGHCHNHAERLPHICFVNPPLDTIGGLVWPLELLLIGLLSVPLGSQIAGWIKHIRLFRRLKATGILVRNEYFLLPWSKPHAFTVGYFFPRILISTSLEEALSSEELGLVLAHEAGHRNRRDTLRLSLAQGFAWLHLPKTRKMLMADLHLAIEQSCDEDAAHLAKDHLRVAEIIVKIERLLKKSDTGWAVDSLAFIKNNSRERILSLLAEGRFDKPLFPAWALAVPLLALAALLMPGGVHSLIEYMLLG